MRRKEPRVAKDTQKDPGMPTQEEVGQQTTHLPHRAWCPGSLFRHFAQGRSEIGRARMEEAPRSSPGGQTRVSRQVDRVQEKFAYKIEVVEERQAKKVRQGEERGEQRQLRRSLVRAIRIDLSLTLDILPPPVCSCRHRCECSQASGTWATVGGGVTRSKAACRGARARTPHTPRIVWISLWERAFELGPIEYGHKGSRHHTLCVVGST